MSMVYAFNLTISLPCNNPCTLFTLSTSTSFIRSNTFIIILNHFSVASAFEEPSKSYASKCLAHSITSHESLGLAVIAAVTTCATNTPKSVLSWKGTTGTVGGIRGVTARGAGGAIGGTGGANIGADECGGGGATYAPDTIP